MNKLIAWILFFLCTVVAISASLVWQIGGDSWYQSLIKPAIAPPNWVFGPVWTILYLLIATSGWRIMYAPQNPNKSIAMGLWSLQMVINTIWTPVYFGAHNIAAAFYYIVALVVVIAAYAVVSWKIDKTASVLFWPYLCWVSFATLLNYFFLIVNI